MTTSTVRYRSGWRSLLAMAPMLVFCSLPGADALARPAPWYWWESQTSDARVCSQTSPGPAWTRGSTAFRDARCEQPLAAAAAS